MPISSIARPSHLHCRLSRTFISRARSRSIVAVPSPAPHLLACSSSSRVTFISSTYQLQSPTRNIARPLRSYTTVSENNTDTMGAISNGTVETKHRVEKLRELLKKHDLSA